MRILKRGGVLELTKCKIMRKIDRIILHCTATKEGRNFKAADIDRWHKERGFEKIGYHFVVDLLGKIECGRALDEIGAHCLRNNSTSAGIVYVGGLSEVGSPLDTRTESQKTALRALISYLKARFPNASVFGHRDFAAKACPCFDAHQEYASVPAMDLNHPLYAVFYGMEKGFAKQIDIFQYEII